MLLVEEIPHSCSSFELFQRFAADDYSFLLDSGMDAEKLGRYSFMGSEPYLIFRSKGEKAEFIYPDHVECVDGDPFELLRPFLHRFSYPTMPDLPPFLGGAIGYFAYDLGHFIEELPDTTTNDIGIPDCYIAFYDAIVAVDHILNKTYLCVSPQFALNCPKDNSRQAHARLQWLKEKVSNNKAKNLVINYELVEASIYPDVQSARYPIISNFTRDDYIKAIKRAKEYIAAGDIYQVNLSQRFTADLLMHPFELYTRLRTRNPAPFAAYLNFDDVAIVSSSPERFLQFSADTRTVYTRPIKGTRPRGATPEEDAQLADELLNSEKDRAELIMIIDLERNDLGRVCEIGSVRVPELIVLEKYATVYHLVSTVVGKLPPDKDHIDLLKATFPGGSITGAPKIRSMEIIDELEPTKRSLYTGAIGYLSFTGNMDLNIVIRTFIVKNGKAYFQVGGGIVADSDPEAEYQETLDKARALFDALQGNSENW